MKQLEQTRLFFNFGRLRLKPSQPKLEFGLGLSLAIILGFSRFMTFAFTTRLDFGQKVLFRIVCRWSEKLEIELSQPSWGWAWQQAQESLVAVVQLYAWSVIIRYLTSKPHHQTPSKNFNFNFKHLRQTSTNINDRAPKRVVALKKLMNINTSLSQVGPGSAQLKFFILN